MKVELIIIFDHESLDRFASKCDSTCKKSEMLKACKNMFLKSRALCLTLEVDQYLETVHVKCVKMYVECVKIYVIGVKMYVEGVEIYVIGVKMYVESVKMIVAILRKCEIPGKLTLTFDL